jgi:hypothetical protein
VACNDDSGSVPGGMDDDDDIDDDDDADDDDDDVEDSDDGADDDDDNDTNGDASEDISENEDESDESDGENNDDDKTPFDLCVESCERLKEMADACELPDSESECSENCDFPDEPVDKACLDAYDFFFRCGEAQLCGEEPAEGCGEALAKLIAACES